MLDTASVVPISGAYLPMFTELNDLKRVRSAGRDGSIAVRLFRLAWAALRTQDSGVAVAITGRALAAARLGDLDASFLADSGIPAEARERIVVAAVHAVAAALPVQFRDRLATAADVDLPSAIAALPAFVAALEQQPRAGLTCPGKPRIVLEPPENHAEHCLMVAVYGVLIASLYGADEEIVFLAALAHHFHNAGMPDAGFTGEVLLGSSLDTMMRHHTQACLKQLDPRTVERVRRARTILADAETPEGRAFHAADVIDRVLQIRQHLRAATLTMDVVLGDMALVHEGPVKSFHDHVLEAVGLL